MKKPYLAAILALARMHRQFLDLLKSEIEDYGIHDINNVQTHILYSIGREETTVGELMMRGYYLLGSNVPYNVRKLARHGYLWQQRSRHDRRVVRVGLTDKGLRLWQRLDATFERHGAELAATIAADAMSEANAGLQQLERFWLGRLGYGAGGSDVPALSSAA